MFFDNEIRIERARNKRRMYEREEMILFNFISGFFTSIPGRLFGGKSKKKKSTKTKSSAKRKNIQLESIQRSSVSDPMSLVGSNSSTKKTVALLAIAGVAAAATFAAGKVFYSKK